MISTYSVVEIHIMQRLNDVTRTRGCELCMLTKNVIEAAKDTGEEYSACMSKSEQQALSSDAAT